jgi:hypothetical protein
MKESTKTRNPALSKAENVSQYPLEVILTCVGTSRIR